ncbi:MAG TPA: ATP phosphoribosyltransferase regulatory subunit [Coriobacteriia bacterium]
MRPVTPRGFRDVLFEEAAERRVVTAAVSDVFMRYAYRFVETPAVEEYATLEAAVGATVSGAAFRLVDLDGSLLALRPEMTLPIARLAAARLGGSSGPQRLCYAADVYREHASLRGESRQFAQLGVELLAVSGPASDAEVVCVLVDALRATGLTEFTVGVGTVAVLRALIGAAASTPEWAASLMAAAHARNLVAFDALTAAQGVPSAVGSALRTVVRIAGGREAIAACREAAGAVGCAGALDALESAWDLLEAAGAADRVRVDFGILRSFDYYTGLIVEAYAPGLGLPLGGGGRYDDLLAAFGTPMPAAGFALSLERVMIALAAQGVEVPVRGIDALVGGDPAACARVCSRLRAGGWRVQASATRTADALVGEARDAGAVWWMAGEDAALTRVSDGAALALEPLPAPPALEAANQKGGVR